MHGLVIPLCNTRPFSNFMKTVLVVYQRACQTQETFPGIIGLGLGLSNSPFHTSLRQKRQSRIDVFKERKWHSH